LLERHFAETQSAPHAVRLPITFAARCEYVQREPQDKTSERRTMATIQPIETLRLRSLVAYHEPIGDLVRRRWLLVTARDLSSRRRNLDIEAREVGEWCHEIVKSVRTPGPDALRFFDRMRL
jgi:hypothetical protein